MEAIKENSNKREVRVLKAYNSDENNSIEEEDSKVNHQLDQNCDEKQLKKDLLDKPAADEDTGISDQNYKFYLEYCKLVEANKLINNQLDILTKEKQNLTHEINKYETLKNRLFDGKVTLNDTYTNKRRKRRMKNEISRGFLCPIDGCGKSYGSEGSLNQHLKLKHKE